VSIGNPYYNSWSNEVNHFGTKATHWKICVDRGETIMSCKNKGNPVSNKSKLCMENTLLKLMQTENYQKITIQEITDNAGLSDELFTETIPQRMKLLKTVSVKYG
jgi:hypothetical protein